MTTMGVEEADDGSAARSYDVVVVGGGIAGAAAALRAGQYMLSVAWVRGDRQTAKASRAEYVYNIDNMIGVHPGIVRAKAAELLAGEEHAAARAVLASGALHISTNDIIENVVERLREGYADTVSMLELRATGARRTDDGGFAIELADGAEVRGGALVVATGVMDMQPSIRKHLRSGRVRDGIEWVYPYANNETLLYCIRCEGHLVRGVAVAVVGAGEQAAQIALMLHERYGVSVALLGNGEPLEATDDTRRLLDAYGITFYPNRIVELIDGRPEAARGRGPERQPKGAALGGFELDDGTVVEARFGMVAMGLFCVYNELPRALGAELADPDAPAHLRHVLVDAWSETSVPGLFCVGDMAASRAPGPMMKQVYTAQEYAVRAVDQVERRIRRERRRRLLDGAPCG